MPISLDSFQRTLDTSNVQGLVKLSNDGADVKAVGSGFFARHFGAYTKPTAEENNATRLAFYESVVDKFHCQGEVLDRLRKDLGIGADGNITSGEKLSVGDAKEILNRVKTAMDEQSANVRERKNLLDGLKKGGFVAGAILENVTKLLNLDNPKVANMKLGSEEARAIRHYAMDAHTNFTVRDNLYKQLEREGLCQGEIGAQVRKMLDLDDREKMLEPLPKQVRESVIAFAKDNSATVHAERIAAFKLPPDGKLANLVAPDKLQGCEAILADAGATMEQLAGVVRAINEFSLAQEHESWSAQVDGALAQLSADVGADCSSMKDAILSGIKGGLLPKYNDAQEPAIVSKEQVRGDFTAALAKIIDGKKAMKACLDGAAHKLPPPVLNYLRAKLATDVEFSSPEQMKALAENHGAAIPLQSLRFADNVTEGDYLGALATLKEKLGSDVGDNKGSKLLCKMFLDIGKLTIEAEEGKPLPGMDSLKPMMMKHASQLLYVSNQIRRGEDFCCGRAARDRGIDADLMMVRTFAEQYGIGEELNGVKPASGADRKLSPILEKLLEYSGVSHGHRKINDGQHFDFKLQSAFQEAMLAKTSVSLKFADNAEEYPGIPEAFSQGFKDYLRSSSGLKVGDTVVAYANEAPAQRDAFIQAMTAKLERFFGADAANGMRAARIIGQIVHQGLPADILTGIRSSGEPSDLMPLSDNSHILNYSVQRGKDGSYGIHFTGVYLYRLLPTDDGMQWLDSSRSKVTFELDLTLSFDAGSGKPSLSFSRPPTMSGQLTPLGFGLGDISRLNSVRDPVTDNMMSSIAEQSGVLNDPEVRHAVFEVNETPENTLAAANLLSSRILSGDDFTMLKILGYGYDSVEQMISGMASDGSVPKLGKEIIGRLKDPATRDSAMHDLATMAAPIARQGWIAGVPNVDPAILNLVTVADLSMIGSGLPSDAEMVANFIMNSTDPEVKKIPADLQSPDPSVVEAAKTRTRQIATDLRREAGIDLLRNHIPGISGDDINRIRNHMDATQYQHLLDHIVERDAFLDDAVRSFQSFIDGAKILEAGMNAQPLQ